MSYRTDLALRITKRLLTPSCLETTVRDGVFALGSPQSGKSAFLRDDLEPALKKAGARVVRVELKESMTGTAARDAVLAGLTAEFCDVFGEVSRVGQADGDSIAYWMLKAVSKTQSDWVLILDEFSPLVRSRTGENLLCALKAARDAVNLRYDNPNATYFLVIGVTSDERAIRKAVDDRLQAFYGADRVDFIGVSREYLQEDNRSTHL